MMKPKRWSEDIVSTSRESLEKFIRELHDFANHVKICRFGEYETPGFGRTSLIAGSSC